MKTSSEKSTSSHATPANQAANRPFIQKAGGSGFVEPAVQARAVGVQAKLTVNEPGDAQEQEADRMADKVVQRLANPEPATVQKAAMPEEQVQRAEEEEVQKSGMPEEQVQREEEEQVQKAEMPEDNIQRAEAASGAPAEPGPDFTSRLQSSKGGGSSLPAETRDDMESGFGADFSNVRVHTGQEAAGMSRDINAQAFTHGNDIYFNEGKYNPGSKEGQHLLAHELTHTVQQGGAQRKEIQKATEKPKPAPATAPTAALDISQQFNPDVAWAAYLAENPAGAPVNVKIGGLYSGTILVNQKAKPTEAGPGKFELDERQGKQTLSVQGLSFLNPLRDMGFEPVLVLNKFGEGRKTTGFLSVKGKGITLGNPQALLETFNKNMEQMGFLGLDKFKLDGIKLENTFDNGRLLFNVSGIKTAVGGYLKAGVGLGISGENFTFDVVADVDVPGIAAGNVEFKRTTEGNLEGRGTVEANIANVQATLLVEFLAGQLTIKGTGTINSEKFSGSLTLLVTDAETADETVNSELGVQKVEQEAQSSDKKPAPKSNKRVLVGWGTVQATITPWLAGTAKVGVNSKGHITIVGEISMPNEVVLMEKKGKKITLIDFEIRAGYGVPLVGQVFIFGGIELFVNAGFGPLVLRDVKFTGQYSTDPDVLQHFMITGTLGINAFAILGLEASAGVGLTLIGHDIKAGLAVTAAAGIKAYAEATPSFEYIEKGAGKGGKVGEAHLKGHFEAAAQLFLMLGGKFFVELDSPWWSPAPDETWEYPLGSVEYPIGDSMGIGADIDWLVGSPEAPELKFSPVEFNPEKFTEDVMADPPPGKGAGGEKDQQGSWTDETGGGNLEDQPQTSGKDKDSKNKKEDLSKLSAEERYMRGLDEISKVADAAKSKPITEKMLQAKIDKVKKKYGLEQAKIKDKSDDNASVFVKHAGEDNGKHLLEVPLMSEKERFQMLKSASDDFQQLLDTHTDEQQTISRADAEAIGEKITAEYYVVECMEVIDGGKSWDFQLDLGDTTKKWPGKAKREKEEVKEGEKKEGEELPKEEKEKMVVEGLEALHQEEQKYLENGAIKQEEAEQVASKILKTYPVFTSLVVIDGGETWDYHYTASPGSDEKGKKKEKMPLPESDKPQFGPTLHGFGTSMHIKRLTKKGEDGTKPTVKNSNWNALNFRGYGGGRYYVRGHLLNEKLHGKGNDWKNLTPLTSFANTQLHEPSVEWPIKQAVDENYVVNYKVEAVYGRGPSKEKVSKIKKLNKINKSEKEILSWIVEAEEFVPKYLICNAYKQKFDENTGEWEDQPKEDIVSNYIVENEIEEPRDYSEVDDVIGTIEF